MKTKIAVITAVAILAGSAAFAASDEGVSYAVHIKPLMEKRCFACHGDNSPNIEEFDANKEKFSAMMVGPRMNSYDLLVDFVSGGDAGAIMRRLDNGDNKADGKPGNMHIHLGSSDEERAENLLLFKRWVGHWTHKRQSELTEDDHKLFKLLD